MSYNDNKVEIMAAGYGFAAISGTTGPPADIVFVDEGRSFDAVGTLGTVQLRLYAADANANNSVKLKIARGSDMSALTLVHDIDITSQVNAVKANGRFTVSLDLLSSGYAVQAGDFIGFYFGSTNPIYFVKDSAVSDGDIQRGAAGDQTGATINVNSSSTTERLMWDATVWTNEYTPFADDNSAAGWGNGDTVNLPAFTGEGQYIILSAAQVPDTETLDIALKYTAADGSDTTAKTITINFDGGANDAKITMDAYGAFTDAITGEEGEDLDVHIWIDPTGDDCDVFYVNRTTGQGAQGAADFKHFSLTDGATASIADFDIKRITFTNTGAGATIDKITVCRKPFVVLGDSFISSDMLSGITDNCTQTRVTISGKVTGMSVLKDSAGNSTALKTRWSEQFVFYRDVVFMLVNGPGLNDIANNINTEVACRAYAGRLSGAIGKIVGEAIDTDVTRGGENEIVLCEMIPYLDADYSSAWLREFQSRYNSVMRQISATANSPIASMTSYDSGYSDGGTHPTVAGRTWIGQQLALVYEAHTTGVMFNTLCTSAVEASMQTVLETNNLDHVANTTGEVDLVDAPNATAVTAIQSGLATASALATVDTVVDTILTDVTALNDVSAADVIAALKAATGFTAGGTLTYAQVIKIIAASVAGDVQDKTGSTTTQDVLDADDGSTVVAEITPSATTPYRSVTLS